MNTVILMNDPTIKALHNSVKREFSCNMERIIGRNATDEKKVTVFVLNRFYNCDVKTVAMAYAIYPIYVPGYLAEISKRYISDDIFRKCIIKILTELENAKENLDRKRSGNIN